MKKLVIKGKEISVPIIQGGMGVGVSRSNLATSVINCGAVGTISAAQIGFIKPEFSQSVKKSYEMNLVALEEEINKVRKNSKGFLAVNILYVTRQYQQLAELCAKLKVDAVISGAGLPFDMPLHLKNTQTAMIPIVSSSKALNVIIKKWKRKYDCLPDAVIVEGPMAGGHLGIRYDQIGQEVDDLQTRVLDVLNYVKDNNHEFAVLAAGGVYTADDVKEMLELGCDGVQIGTRFIATQECDADIKFKNKFIEAKKEDIVYVKSPVGYPGRAIRNNLTEALKLGNIPVEKCVGCVLPCKGKHDDTVYCITDKLIDAVNGNVDDGLVFSGANGYRINEISTVRKVINELISKI